MSNPISYDPLLVAYLARELNERLAGRACRALPRFGEERTLLLPLTRDEALRWELHPLRGWVRLISEEDGEAEGDLICTGVTAPPDERSLEIHLREEARFRSQSWRLVVELHTNQWNALLLDAASERILSVLWPRTAGGRVLRAGATYAPPPPRPRLGSGEVAREEAWEHWRERVANAPPEERKAALLRHFAWTGSLSAAPLLGAALESDDEVAHRDAFERWWRLRSFSSAAPVVLRLPSGLQPYPLPLPGLSSEAVSSLLTAMEQCADAQETSGAPPAPETAMLRERAVERLRSAERRVKAIRGQLERAGEAEQMRGYGDLLLAHLHQVPRGTESVRLPGWEGDEVEISLDPTLTPAQNATAWYEKARRRTRALERLPALLEEAETEARRWEAALQEGKGELPGWAVAELERSQATDSAGQSGDAPSLPYRRFRTSGGLEVRVGRSSKDNDRLTFGSSAPDDVWLHARSVPGSHVILRWPDPEGAPPARDLSEAAGLAALYSKARTSGLVAVDWTRRKHVRKPRGAPPGAVIPQRVKTVFVEPDEALEERLRDPVGS